MFNILFQKRVKTRHFYIDIVFRPLQALDLLEAFKESAYRALFSSRCDD